MVSKELGIIAGDKASGIQLVMEEAFETGDRVELLIGLEISRKLNALDLTSMAKILFQKGFPLLSPLQAGINPWPETLRVVFSRYSHRSLGALPAQFCLEKALESLSGLKWKVLGWRMRRLPV